MGNLSKSFKGLRQLINAEEEYRSAIEAGDSEAAIKARNKGIDGANKMGNPQKAFDSRMGSADKLYKDTFGVEGGTIKYNDQKGEAGIEKGYSPAPSEKNGGGTFLTAGAGMDGHTMLTKGYAKKKQLGAA